jgi:hypothetical protein
MPKHLSHPHESAIRILVAVGAKPSSANFSVTSRTEADGWLCRTVMLDA